MFVVFIKFVVVGQVEPSGKTLQPALEGVEPAPQKVGLRGELLGWRRGVGIGRDGSRRDDAVDSLLLFVG